MSNNALIESSGAALPRVPFQHAYLIVICDCETNAILSVTVWSSPEWEQSRQLDQRTFVAYKVSGHTFQEAKDRLLQSISDPRSRYHYLMDWFEKEPRC